VRPGHFNERPESPGTRANGRLDVVAPAKELARHRGASARLKHFGSTSSSPDVSTDVRIFPKRRTRQGAVTQEAAKQETASQWSRQNVRKTRRHPRDPQGRRRASNRASSPTGRSNGVKRHRDTLSGGEALGKTRVPGQCESSNVPARHSGRHGRKRWCQRRRAMQVCEPARSRPLHHGCSPLPRGVRKETR